MITTVQPQEYFPISRVLPDPSDSSTYYVKAFIRNPKTNVTIGTANLADQGNHIFAANYRMPNDTSGQGLFITITTKVYSDSAYTVQDTSYGDDQDTFLIYDRNKYVAGLATQISALLGVGSGGEIDYKKIRKIVTEVVVEKLAKIKKEEVAPEEADLTPVLSRLDEMKRILSEKPEEITPEKLDFSPILAELNTLKKSIEGIDIPDSPNLDLSPVLDALSEIHVQDIVSAADETLLVANKLKETLDNLPDAIKTLNEVKDQIKEFLYTISSKSNAPQTTPRSPAVNQFGKVPLSALQKTS